jgi:hypothetical protein
VCTKIGIELPEPDVGVVKVASADEVTVVESIVLCQIGSLAPGASAQVTITVQTTAAGTMVNAAVVTPDDETPGDNTSTVSTGVLEPAAQAVALTPAFTG